jgi:hypothetical protein
VAAFALVSCRQILGIEERKQRAESPDAGSPKSGATKTRCGGFDQPSAACARCLDKECCDAATACDADETCRAAYGCQQGCAPDDSDCIAWCLGSTARSDTLAKLAACASSSCNAACGLGCGQLVNGSSACDACVHEHCCDENRACATDEACVEVDFCSHRCLPAGSINCSNVCTTEYQAGADEFATRGACVAKNCAEECTSATAWSCLDENPTFLKPPSADPITFGMSIVEFVTEKPYEGLTVKACSQSDLDCGAPLATATTDANGRFEMTVPSGPSGFNGYIDLSGQSIFPALYYFLPPLIVGGDRGRLRLPAADTITLLVKAIGVELDPTRGHLALVPWDCTLSPAPGVSLSIDTADAMTTTYYFRQGAPSHAATETDVAPALGGAVNLPARLALVRATVTSRDQPSAEVNFNIRAGTLTASSLPPSP